MFHALGYSVSVPHVSEENSDSSGTPSVGLFIIKGFSHHPHVDPSVLPVNQSLQHVPFSLCDEVSKELQ